MPIETPSRGFLDHAYSSSVDDVPFERRGGHAAKRQGILIVGSKLLPTDVLHSALAYDEIFVLAQAVPEPTDEFVVDEELAYRKARERLAATTAWLRSRGASAVSGAVGDADFIAARRDAAALVPGGFFVQDA